MGGQINRQGFSYRQGLVLGLTMAEIMVLLVFCLLIAMATFLKSEQSKLADARRELKDQIVQNERNDSLISTLRQDTALAEKLSKIAGDNVAVTDENWRDLVESRAELAAIRNEGTSLKEVRDKAAAMTALQKAGIDMDKAKRDAEIVAAVKRALPDDEKLALTPTSIADLVARNTGSPADSQKGHQWPPIISLSEANGYFFKTGSAELSAPFREALLTTTPEEILRNIKQYDVDVIEVVGHTDEQGFGVRVATPLADGAMPLVPVQPPPRLSNLDRGLVSFLRSGGDVSRLTPVDNAGLGLARAASVVSVLRLSPKLSGYKMIPLSGGQLINTDETLALGGTPGGDVARRRRIEIRLRKSAPREVVTTIVPQPVVMRPATSTADRPTAKPTIQKPAVSQSPVTRSVPLFGVISR